VKVDSLGKSFRFGLFLAPFGAHFTNWCCLNVNQEMEKRSLLQALLCFGCLIREYVVLLLLKMYSRVIWCLEQRVHFYSYAVGVHIKKIKSNKTKLL
jgi:hypothetical protein